MVIIGIEAFEPIATVDRVRSLVTGRCTVRDQLMIVTGWKRFTVIITTG